MDSAQPPANIVDIYKSQGWNDQASIDADIKAGGWQSKVPKGTGGGSGQSTTQKYFDTYQQQLAGLFGEGVKTFSDIKSNLTPTSDMPELLDRVSLFEGYRELYGIDELEAQMNDLKGQEDNLVAQTRINVNAERGQQVATDVIEGRVGEQERTARENLDFIQRQMSRINDRLTTSYKVIDMYMNFENMDYQDAVQRYNDEFKQNLDTINLMRGIQGDARDVVRLDMEGQKLEMDKIRLESDMKQREIDNARANLQIYTNAITNGNLDFSKLSPDQQAQMSKLEVQSGLPVGFISSLQLNQKERIAFTSTNNGVTQVGIIGVDGNITVKSYGTPTATSGGTKTKYQSQVISNLNSQIGDDGYVAPDVWKKMEQTWISLGQSRDSFQSTFSGYVNPAHHKDYGVPEKIVNPDKYSTPAKQDLTTTLLDDEEDE